MVAKDTAKDTVIEIVIVANNNSAIQADLMVRKEISKLNNNSDTVTSIQYKTLFNQIDLQMLPHLMLWVLNIHLIEQRVKIIHNHEMANNCNLSKTCFLKKLDKECDIYG